MGLINFLPASVFKNRPEPPNCFVVPDVFLPHLFNPEPNQIWYGSRFSAKSHTKARELLARAAKNEYFRGIYARQKQTDVKNSQYQLFKDTIQSRPWLNRQFVCRDSDFIIKNLITGNMLIPGSFDEPQKIMSVADPTDIWVEEPITDKGEINQKDYLSMFGSLRNSKGIPPRFHFTFNPISSESWIYTEFFQKQTIPSNRVLANYGDNPFCPQSAYEFFAWLKDVDEDKYEIDALGQWGVPKPDRPFWHQLLRVNPLTKKTKLQEYLGNCRYDPRFDVYITFDFNVTNSALIRQKQNGTLCYLKEYHLDGVDLEELCQEIAQTYGRNFIHFTGDASGNNRSAYTRGNRSAWGLIEGYMSQYGARFCDFDAVPEYNIETSQSCFVVNALIKHFEGRMIIDEANCPVLVSDIKKMRRTKDGSLDKDDANKKNYGHLGDCLRYDLSNFEYDVFKKISSQ